MQNDYFWICPNDQKKESWIFYEIKKSKLLKNEYCQSISCEKCGKFDEILALNLIDKFSMSINASSDYCLTGDGIVLVSSQLKNLIINAFPSECTFIEHHTLNDFSICIPNRSFDVDAATCDMQFHRKCGACGRYRETSGFPVVSAELSSGLTLPNIFFENIRGRVFFYACSARFKTAIEELNTRGIYFDVVLTQPGHG